MTTQELLDGLKSRIGTTDADISFLEEATTTLSGLAQSEDWKTKYEENDLAWREKYKSRFEIPATQTPPLPTTTPPSQAQQPPEHPHANLTIADIFKKKEG